MVGSSDIEEMYGDLFPHTMADCGGIPEGNRCPALRCMPEYHYSRTRSARAEHGRPQLGRLRDGVGAGWSDCCSRMSASGR